MVDRGEDPDPQRASKHRREDPTHFEKTTLMSAGNLRSHLAGAHEFPTRGLDWDELNELHRQDHTDDTPPPELHQDHSDPPRGVTVACPVSYVDVVTAFEGPRGIRPWTELAWMLERRGGWRFEIELPFIRWVCDWDPDRWASAQALDPPRAASPPPQFSIWQRHPPSDDEVSLWNCPTVEQLEALLDDMEDPRRPARPPDIADLSDWTGGSPQLALFGP